MFIEIDTSHRPSARKIAGGNGGTPFRLQGALGISQFG